MCSLVSVEAILIIACRACSILVCFVDCTVTEYRWQVHFDVWCRRIKSHGHCKEVCVAAAHVPCQLHCQEYSLVVVDRSADWILGYYCDPNFPCSKADCFGFYCDIMVQWSTAQVWWRRRKRWIQQQRAAIYSNGAFESTFATLA